jgi:5,10-methylenetetrahydrofolate reductase
MPAPSKGQSARAGHLPPSNRSGAPANDVVENNGTDRIDIALIHDVDVFTHGADALEIRFGEAMNGAYRALDRLRSEGAVKAIGVGVNPAAIDLAHEIRRFEWKVDAGAEFAVTQPVFDPDQLERFLERIAHVRIPIVAGIWPLVSVRNAEFLANEVPGVAVPQSIISRMRAANERSKDHAVAEGIDIAREMLDRVRGAVQGAQVSAPFGKVELALEVFAGAGLGATDRGAT